MFVTFLFEKVFAYDYEKNKLDYIHVHMLQRLFLAWLIA